MVKVTVQIETRTGKYNIISEHESGDVAGELCGENYRHPYAIPLVNVIEVVELRKSKTVFPI